MHRTCILDCNHVLKSGWVITSHYVLAESPAGTNNVHRVVRATGDQYAGKWCSVVATMGR